MSEPAVSISAVATSSAPTMTGNGLGLITQDLNGGLRVSVVGSGGNVGGGGGLPVVGPGEWQFIAASQTNKPVGAANGAVGDNLDLMVIIPTNTSPGLVAVRDGTGTANNMFVGGATSISSLAPMTVPGPGVSLTGNWNVTTGANVSVMAKGSFT